MDKIRELGKNMTPDTLAPVQEGEVRVPLKPTLRKIRSKQKTTPAARHPRSFHKKALHQPVGCKGDPPPATRVSKVPPTQLPALDSVHTTDGSEASLHGVAACQLSGNSTMSTRNTHPVESTRHLELIDSVDKQRDERMQQLSRPWQQQIAHQQQGAVVHAARVFSDFIGFTKPQEPTAEFVVEELPCNLSTEQRRRIRVNLSMDDPSLPTGLRKAHQEWVKGTPLQEMRTMGIGPDELIHIGVGWADWLQKQQYGVKELNFMGGTWQHAVSMGFTPEDIVLHRDKCGPNLLREHWKVTFDDLQWYLGLTVDEAVGVSTSPRLTLPCLAKASRV